MPFLHGFRFRVGYVLKALGIRPVYKQAYHFSGVRRLKFLQLVLQ